MTSQNQMDMTENKMDSHGDAVDALGGHETGPTVKASQAPQAEMKASDFYADCYNMDHSERGQAIIFNNKKFDSSTRMGDRVGTDEDAKNLYKVFVDMGFDTTIKNDLTTQEMESLLVKTAKMDHKDADCFTCAILSHGEEGLIYGKNGPIQIDKLIAPFKGDRCQTLAGKPKIFFIQACRGQKLDSGVEVADARGEMEIDVQIRKIPTEADFLMAYSVVPGYFAWRNSSRGSWFIQALVQVLEKNWKRMDLLTMMTRVSKIVAHEFESNASQEFMNRKKQIPCVTSMLTRDVYFNPKK